MQFLDTLGVAFLVVTGEHRFPFEQEVVLNKKLLIRKVISGRPCQILNPAFRKSEVEVE